MARQREVWADLLKPMPSYTHDPNKQSKTDEWTDDKIIYILYVPHEADRIDQQPALLGSA